MPKNRHHRKPKSIGGNGKKENISLVDSGRHILWHALFRNMTAEEIFNEINKVWLDPDYYIVLKHRRK
jgi:hypothetical protein